MGDNTKRDYEMPDKEKRLTKVATFQIVKPVNMSWDAWNKQLNILRRVRYILWRFANLALSEAYLNFYKSKKGLAGEKLTVGELNKNLRKTLIEEGKSKKEKEPFTKEELSHYSENGALSGYVYGAFWNNEFRSVTSKSKWSDVIKGRVSLPVFRKDLAIPIQCNKVSLSRIEKTEAGDYEVDLRICMQQKEFLPKGYPRVLLSTERISDGQRAVLERLVSNTTNSPEGYCHRIFRIKEKRGKWELSVTYDFPKSEAGKLHPDIIVGVDLGWSVPLYAAISNGYDRIGWRKLRPLAERIRHLQKQVKARRFSIQKGGQQDLAGPTARAGHGRKRMLAPIEKLEGKIDNAYKTLNHQLSHCVVKFAKDHGAGVIQVEDLDGLKDTLTGTFLGQNWRYYQLQNYVKYKAEEAGIKYEKVNPCMTSRRCSGCGVINKDFTFKYRQDYKKKNGKSAMFECPECKRRKKGYEPLIADYNAAKNLTIPRQELEEKIRLQCEKQGIEYKE